MELRRFLEVEAKRFEVIQTDGSFNVIERGRGWPKCIYFPKLILGKVVNFCSNACDGNLMEDFKESINFKGGSLFLSRQSNAWAHFVRVCEWRMKENDQFIIVPVSEKCLGWVGMKDLLLQMEDLNTP